MFYLSRKQTSLFLITLLILHCLAYIYFFACPSPQNIFRSWGEHEHPLVPERGNKHDVFVLHGGIRHLLCRAESIYRKQFTYSDTVSSLFAKNCVEVNAAKLKEGTNVGEIHFIQNVISSTPPPYSLVVTNDFTMQEVSNGEYQVIDELIQKLTAMTHLYPQS
ncbi:hypothetical protein EON65_57265, partial [archaeon]